MAPPPRPPAASIGPDSSRCWPWSSSCCCWPPSPCRPNRRKSTTSQPWRFTPTRPTRRTKEKKQKKRASEPRPRQQAGSVQTGGEACDSLDHVPPQTTPHEDIGLHCARIDACAPIYGCNGLASASRDARSKCVNGCRCQNASTDAQCASIYGSTDAQCASIYGRRIPRQELSFPPCSPRMQPQKGFRAPGLSQRP